VNLLGAPATARQRVKPLIGHVGGHKATDCPHCLALAVAAYKLGQDDAMPRKRMTAPHGLEKLAREK
jgi:hypothetical protein